MRTSLPQYDTHINLITIKKNGLCMCSLQSGSHFSVLCQKLEYCLHRRLAILYANFMMLNGNCTRH